MLFIFAISSEDIARTLFSWLSMLQLYLYVLNTLSHSLQHRIDGFGVAAAVLNDARRLLVQLHMLLSPYGTPQYLH